MKIPEFKIRTDLALEEREGLKEAAEEVSGVSFKKWEGKRSAAQITEVKVLNEHGAKALGKPMGSYLTLEADKLLLRLHWLLLLPRSIRLAPRVYTTRTMLPAKFLVYPRLLILSLNL